VASLADYTLGMKRSSTSKNRASRILICLNSDVLRLFARAVAIPVAFAGAVECIAAIAKEMHAASWPRHHADTLYAFLLATRPPAHIVDADIDHVFRVDGSVMLEGSN